MATVEGPELLIGNHVKFEYSKEEKAFIPYVFDRKDIYLQYADGRVYDPTFGIYIKKISFNDLKNNIKIDPNKDGAVFTTNLVPITNYFRHESKFKEDIVFYLRCINEYIESSNEWIDVKDITLDDIGLFRYSKKRAYDDKKSLAKREIYQAMHSMLTLEEKERILYKSRISLPDNMYIGKLSFMRIANDTQQVDYPISDKYSLFEFNSSDNTYSSLEDGNCYCMVRDINIDETKDNLNKDLSMSDSKYSYYVLGINEVASLEEFVQYYDLFIDPKKDIIEQINAYFEGLDIDSNNYDNSKENYTLFPKVDLSKRILKKILETK